MSTKKTLKEDWYRMSVHATLEYFETHHEHGLSDSEAQKRIARVGRNQISEGKREGIIDKIVTELRNPLTFILLSAGILTTLLAEYVDATVIFIALLINIAISLYQEGRADHAFEKLRSSQEQFAVVIRDGVKSRVSACDITPGDLIFLEAGMQVPADLRLVTSNNLEINESPLTGEWIDVAKHTEAFDTVIPFAEQRNMAFMGTYVSGGTGLGVVTAIGDETKIGAIASSLRENVSPKTPLQENIAKVARFLSFIVLGALVVIFALGLLRGLPFTELILISIAIAVAAIPEGLPAAVTVVLALGMEAILKRGGLVRNLLAAETLGSTTVILTDKTGTLTKAAMVVARVVTMEGELAEGERAREYTLHEAHGDERDVLEFATLCSNAFIERKGEGGDPLTEYVVHGRPVERAVVTCALESGLDQTELLRNYPRIDFLPFESRYRVALSLHHIRGMKQKRIYVTGSPEYLLSRAGAVYMAGKSHIVSAGIREKLEHTLKKFTHEGYRLIGVAFRNTSIEHFPVDSAEHREELTDGLILAGFIVLHDPLREDVPEAIALARRAGARVIMATGDNPETARTIARDSGIWREGDEVLTGLEVEHMHDEALAKALKKTTVFARMLPEHKLRIARILSAHGEVVAMTGDGVNDAPALRGADIGVALGSGTEVAKEASDLVLLNNSFTIIVSAIEEGRRIIDNLRKIVAYLLSTSFTEIIAVGGALLIGLPIPILPAQILWTNMLSEGFMNFAFAFEPKEDDLMTRDPKVSGARLMLSRRFMTFIVVVGLSGGFFLLAYYLYLLKIDGQPAPEARTLVFMLLTLGTIFIAFTLKDLRSPLYTIKIFSNKYLLGSLLFALTGLVLALHVDFLRELLRLTPVEVLPNLPALCVFIALELLAVEVAKYVLFPHKGGRVLP